jgi:hypothetical protein
MATREAIMSDEHLDNLRQARTQLIEQRRAFVRVLAGPYDRGKTEQAREGFMETQAAIEAMDRAIEDEEGTRRAVYDRSGGNTQFRFIGHGSQIRAKAKW